MGTPKLLSLSKLLRRSRPSTISLSPPLSSISCSYYFCSTRTPHLPNPSHSPTSKHSLHFPPPLSTVHPRAPYNFSCSLSFSTRGSDCEGLKLDGDSAVTHCCPSSDLKFEHGGAGGSEIAEAVLGVTSGGGGEEPILAVRAVISLLDFYHDLTGWPWWIIIASSTLTLRMALFPILILQLNKLKRIAELFPKLPPPLPPPLSGRSFKDQITLFRKERRAIGCPSYLWFLAYISIQFPCFFLWMTSIRRMSLDHHSGFDCGGTLWFQNLTEYPHGVFGPIFPLLIGGLHFVNVQISFQKSPAENVTGLFGLLVKYYKFYLDILTIPLTFTGFCLPQGSLVYWLTNSSLNLIQQLSLNHPDVRKKLGLPEKQAPVKAKNTEEMATPGLALLDPPIEQPKIPVQNLSPQELLSLSVQLLAKGHQDRAILILRLALDKDPEYIRALVVLGQTLLQKGLSTEAIEYFEHAISKLSIVGYPTEVEDVDLLILASQWAGVAYIRQGKYAEGFVHLERVAHMKEPEDSKSKAHYYDGLVLLGSALCNASRKVEAAKYLRMAAAYDSTYKVYLEQCENDEDNFVNDLVSSRRGDY